MKLASTADRRTFASWAAFATGVGIALHQRHFLLSLAYPDTFRMMLQHRCGDVLAAAFLWAFAETSLATARRIRRLADVAA